MSQGGVQELGSVLRHYDPAQLPFQLGEIVNDRVYLRHGVDVREGDTVFDVGANVGVASAFFAGECGAGVVHSFEPVPPLFALLRENLRKFSACVPHEYGLSTTAGRSSITYYPNAAAMSGLYADPEQDRERVRTYLVNSGMAPQDADRELDGRYRAETMSCELRTLSMVVREHAIEHVDLVKIDVEKAELDVLRGIDDGDWSRVGQVVMEVHDEHDRCASVSELLTARGFAVEIDQDSTWRGTGMHMVYATRREHGTC
jgi:FkbM family methyltransferase